MNDIWKNRFDSLTYGLIYPAFFGNMIYDLLLKKLAWTDTKLVFPDLYISFSIVIFLLIDYMHLHGDMNKIVDKPEKKTWRYILCDIATSILIFFSFVYFKEGETETGLKLFTTIPIIILFYKWDNKMSRYYFIIFSIISSSIAIILYQNFLENSKIKFYVLIYTVISTIFYSFYILFYYVKFCRQSDINYMSKINTKY